mmetsp:Transcript_5175/g.16530  ORF Transcript_5175/g.16530 Transcript_5175/m.16530 type:complete len:89 (+) Transcript_5175:3613-3879(+)
MLGGWSCRWVQQEAPLFADTIAYNIAYGRATLDKPAPAQAPDPSYRADADVVQAAADACVDAFLPQLKDGFLVTARLACGAFPLEGGP